jgi:hypothetical protein
MLPQKKITVPKLEPRVDTTEDGSSKPRKDEPLTIEEATIVENIPIGTN